VRYAELEKEEDEAPKKWNFIGNPIGSPELYAAQEARSDVGAQIQHAENRMAWLSTRIRYFEELSGADAAIAKACATHTPENTPSKTLLTEFVRAPASPAASP
jgi:hypothetical protein